MRGGPASSLIRRFNLETAGHPIRNAIAKVLLACCIGWAPLWLLAWAGGHAGSFFADLRVQALFVFAFPALLVGEDYVDGRLNWAVQFQALLELLPGPELARYQEALRRAARQRDDGRAELVVLALAYLVTGMKYVVGIGVPLFAFEGSSLTLAGLWYTAIAYPLFWFFLLRWAWRFAIWTGVLWRLSRLDLQLVASHADAAGGLRFLAVAQASFSVAVFAVGVAVSAINWRAKVVLSTTGLIAYARDQAIYALFALVVLNLPLLLFCRKMLLAKRRADARFAALMARHGRAFERRWFPSQPEQSPLGNEDMSSQIDLISSFDEASKMRWFPFAFRPLVAELLSGFALPLVPHLLADRQLLQSLIHLMPKLVGG